MKKVTLQLASQPIRTIAVAEDEKRKKKNYVPHAPTSSSQTPSTQESSKLRVHPVHLVRMCMRICICAYMYTPLRVAQRPHIHTDVRM